MREINDLLSYFVEMAKHMLTELGELHNQVMLFHGGQIHSAMPNDRYGMKVAIRFFESMMTDFENDFLVIMMVAWMKQYRHEGPDAESKCREIEKSIHYGDIEKMPDKEEVLMIQVLAHGATLGKIIRITRTSDGINFSEDLPVTPNIFGFLSLADSPKHRIAW